MSVVAPMELKGFAAWILVDGKEVNQYSLETEENKVTCWIASEVGKKFTVRWKDSALYRDVVTAGYVYLDGIKCGGRFIRKSIESQVNTVERSSAGTSMITERPYVFSPIEFTEDDPSLHQRASLHALGEISVVVWRVEIGETRFNPNTTFPDDEKINERSKKGLKHCIKLGEEVQAVQPKVSPCSNLDSEPIVTFVFKYRPFEMLKANGVIPTMIAGEKRRATADPDGDDVKQESLELADEDAQIKALEEQMHVLKARRARRNSKKIKTEPGSQPVFIQGEIIDLT